MTMTYNSLTGAKGAPGSILTWVNYSKISVDLDTFIQETQALLCTLMRTREMKANWIFTIPQNYARIALPAGFLDPIGSMFCASINQRYSHRDEFFVQQIRNYNETNGIFGTDPFTTVNGSPLVVMNLSQNGFTQESNIYITGSTLFNGVLIVGTFPVVEIIDANNFVIDITTLGVLPTASGTGGGATVNYTCDILEWGSANFWSIWDEMIHFDTAFDKLQLMQLLYYKQFPFISPSLQSNFVTARYPFLMRRAIDCMAANWMQESAREQAELTVLTAMVEKVNVENDMHMRGGEYYTENPGDGQY